MPQFACSNGMVALLPPRKPPFCVGKKEEGVYKELRSGCGRSCSGGNRSCQHWVSHLGGGHMLKVSAGSFTPRKICQCGLLAVVGFSCPQLTLVRFALSVVVLG